MKQFILQFIYLLTGVSTGIIVLSPFMAGGIFLLIPADGMNIFEIILNGHWWRFIVMFIVVFFGLYTALNAGMWVYFKVNKDA